MRRRRDYPKITWSESKGQYRATLPVNGKRKDIYGKTEEDVMDRIDAIEDDAARGIDRTMTFREYAARWGALKNAGLKPKSKEVYANALINHILPQLGSLPLGEIKPLHIDEVLSLLNGKSSSLRSKVLFTMSQIFESAIENDLIQKNPCRGRKAGGEKAKIKTPLSKEQQNALCEAVAGTRAELFVLLCLYAGLRGEEARGLLWNNVHLKGDAPYIDVRHTVTYDSVGRPTHSATLKSEAAYRSIPIPPKLKNVLEEKYKKAKSTFVVPAPATGKEMSLSSFVRMWNVVSGYTYITKDKDGKKTKHEVAGVVDFHVTPHQLRHTYITEICASGLDIKKVQYLAGHSTVQMTLNVYD